MRKRIIKTAALILSLVMLLSMASCSNGRIKDYAVAHETEFGAVIIDISIDDFCKKGFAFGDSVDLSFSNGKEVTDIPFYNGYYVRPGDLLLVGYPGYETIRFSCNAGDDTWIMEDLKEGDKVSIKVNKKAKYIDVQNALNIQYSDEREDYPSDEAFANYREIRVGNILPSTLYRSASPVDNRHKRAHTVDSLMAKDGIRYVINLAETEDKLKSYMDADDFDSPWFKSLYSEGDYHLAMMNMNYSSKEFAEKLADSVREITAHDGPFLIHCQEGKDRTGFVCLILEALAGATYDEIKDDYMKTYENYYKITTESDKAKYDMIVDQYLGGMIDAISGQKGADPYSVDLREGAVNYLKNAGMDNNEIKDLAWKLTIIEE